MFNEVSLTAMIVIGTVAALGGGGVVWNILRKGRRSNKTDA